MGAAATTEPSTQSPGIDLTGLGVKCNNLSSMRGDLNPLIYLADNKSSDYLDIIDFLPTLCYDSEEQIISSRDGSEIILKTGPKKPRLENISQMQWMAANSRILAKLLLDGKLGLEGVAQYLSYNVKISSLAQRYIWQTVLMYDREYRRAQATYNFAWGSDVPHLVSVHLVPRQEKVKPSQSYKQVTHNAQSSGQHQMYRKPYTCNAFNTEGKCKFGTNCRFMHECNTCKGPHPACEHPK